MAVTDSANTSVAQAKTTPGTSSLPSGVWFLIRFIAVAAVTWFVMSRANVNIGAIGQGLGLALVGVGVYITFRVLNFPDLSVDGSFPIGGAVAATFIAGFELSDVTVDLISRVTPFVLEPGTTIRVMAELTLLLSFIAGALTGLATALIHVTFKIEGLLASIIVATGAYTITLRTMGTSNIPLLNERTILTPYEDGMQAFLVGTFGDEWRRQSNNMVEIVVFLIVVGVVLAILNWFFRTEIGLTLRAAGRNAQMVRALGADDKRMIVIGLMVSNGLAGMAGALAVQQLGFADVQMGVGMIIRGLAAVMIGEVLLRPKTVGQAIVAASVGMLVFEISRAWVFAALDLNASDVRLVSALVVLSALAAPNIAQRYRDWRRRQQATAGGAS
ncbi:MAG: ABC transporter permease [Chloroflexota bacterium]